MVFYCKVQLSSILWCMLACGLGDSRAGGKRTESLDSGNHRVNSRLDLTTWRDAISKTESKRGARGVSQW